MKKIALLIILIGGLTYAFVPLALRWYGRYQHQEAIFPTQGLPLQKSVTIYKNEYDVPFIEAQTDRDLAVALGLVHAHYRLPQIELSKLIAKGEISTMAGPKANEIDQTLRILQFGKAAKEIIAQYPPETLEWLQGYLEGLNYYIENVHPKPWDLTLMHIEPKRWTLEDLVAVFRMASSDVNWGYLFTFLGQAENSEWKDIWNLYLHHSQGNSPTIIDGAIGMQERGSNSLVIGSKKSQSGAGMIASDPHVSIFLPNLWFLVGYKSPSHHAVGFSVPGTPMISLGRNPDVAWGATNMYSVSSYLFELEQKDIDSATTIEESIPNRFASDTKVKIRNSIYGPIISDSPLLKTKKPLALYWLGHQPSDEITAFLKATRAKNWDQFETAFHTYGVLGLNYVFTDRDGNVGYVPAYRQPLTKTNEKKLIYPTSEFTPAVIDQGSLSREYNPRRGFIASANNKPAQSERDWGWFYASNDRYIRQSELVQSKDKINMEDLKKLQVDTQSLSALSWVTWMKKNTSGPVQQHALFKKLETWDGTYDKFKIEPVIYELLKKELSTTVLRKKFHNTESIRQMEQALFLREVVQEILMTFPIEERSTIVEIALNQIVSKVSSVLHWGQFHPMKVQYLFGHIPWIGDAFSVETHWASGGNDTLFKRAFMMTEKSAAITYGSAARHISDMADPDENYFVLFGAQNGYPFSPKNADQLELWEKGQYINVPLNVTTIQQKFKTKLELQPR
jgi:penicillin amidase